MYYLVTPPLIDSTRFPGARTVTSYIQMSQASTGGQS
jgi:hypothetical protein